MAAGQLGLAGEVSLRIEQGCCGDIRGVGDVEPLPGQHFVQEPEAPGRNAGGGVADDGLDLIFGKGRKDAPEDEKIEILVAHREGEVIARAVARPVAFVVDAPAILIPTTAVLLFAYVLAFAAVLLAHMRRLSVPAP